MDKIWPDMTPEKINEFKSYFMKDSAMFDTDRSGELLGKLAGAGFKYTRYDSDKYDMLDVIQQVNDSDDPFAVIVFINGKTHFVNVESYDEDNETITIYDTWGREDQDQVREIDIRQIDSARTYEIDDTEVEAEIDK